jgi:D-amino peptidase
MRIYISSDIEGVAGVVHGEQGRPGNPEYERARRLMTQEVNAAIAGAFEGGATEILVNDSHGPMRNLLIEDLDPRVRLISGKPKPVSMMEGLDAGAAGVFALGYHARAGSHGILAHTINGFAFARVTVNGADFGESGLYGGYAGEVGVPVLLVSGDDCLRAEVAPLFVGAEIVEVKRAIMNSCAESMTPKAAREAIRAAGGEAVPRAAADHRPGTAQFGRARRPDVAAARDRADGAGGGDLHRRLDAHRPPHPQQHVGDVVHAALTSDQGARPCRPRR